MPKKCVLIVLDGLGDRSYPQLDGLTPLQAAKTPNLDRLASIGANGLYHAGEMGRALASENAHFAMFGYDADRFPGRGPLEALGAGIDPGPGDVAVLAHFAGLEERDGSLFLARDKVKDYSDSEAEALFKAIGTFEHHEVQIELIRTGGLYGVLMIKGDVSPFITDSGPMIDGRPLMEVLAWNRQPDGLPSNENERRTARALKKYLAWSYKTLKELPLNRDRARDGKTPINGMVTQRAGRLTRVMPFVENTGLKGLTISSGIVYHGLARFVGLDIEKAIDTHEPGGDLAQRLRFASSALAEYDFIHVHTKAPDEAGHRKDPLYKKEVIEKLDAGIGEAVGPLVEDPETLVVVTADHSTPAGGTLIHSGEPVPLLMAGPGQRVDTVAKFDEVSAAAGALGCVRGKELLYLILNGLDRAKLSGIMDTPEDRPFWPGNYEPFFLE